MLKQNKENTLLQMRHAPCAMRWQDSMSARTKKMIETRNEVDYSQSEKKLILKQNSHCEAQSKGVLQLAADCASTETSAE
jgi:hypothetical protein